MCDCSKTLRNPPEANRGFWVKKKNKGRGCAGGKQKKSVFRPRWARGATRWFGF
jgi:hypothetical protein